MELKSMKTKAEPKENYPVEAADRSEYPYGLVICLDDDSLNNLGIGLPAVGDEVMIMAVAKVKSASETDTKEGTRRSAELQITDMNVKPNKEVKAKKFYPEME